MSIIQYVTFGILIASAVGFAIGVLWLAFKK